MADIYNKLNRFNSFPLITTSISSILESLNSSNPNRIRCIINNEINTSGSIYNIDDNTIVIENILIKKNLVDMYGFKSEYFNETLTNKDVYIFTGNNYCGYRPTCNTYLYIAVPKNQSLTDEFIGITYRDKYGVEDNIVNSLFIGNNAPISRFAKVNCGFNESYTKDLYYNAHKYKLNLQSNEFDPILDKNKRIGNLLKYELNLVLTRYTGNAMEMN